MFHRYPTHSVAQVAILTTFLALVSGVDAVANVGSYQIEVRYAETGELLPGAELTSLELYMDNVLVEIVEPYEGVYTFNDLAPDHSYQVDAYGTYMWVGSASRTIVVGEVASDTITTPYLGTLRVRVFHSDGITPMADASVEVHSHGGTAWRAGVSTSDGWVSWGGFDRAYLFPNRMPGEQWSVHTSYESVGIAFPVDVNIPEQGDVAINVTTTVSYNTVPEQPSAVNPADDAFISTLTPGFQWTPFQHGGDQQTQAGYQFRVRCDDYVIWDFDSPTDWGVLPVGWIDDSSATGTPTYRVTTFDGKSCLQARTLGGTLDRIKAMTDATYKIGTYEWKVYVPPINEPGACSAIAAWLYSPVSSGDDNIREIDFEIGYGTTEERVRYAIPDGKLMCYMTVHRDYSSGTNHSSHAIPIDPDAWYTLRIIVDASSEGQYRASWMIRKEGDVSFSVGRDDYICGYGPGNTSFRAACSIENYTALWIGDFHPTLDKDAYFDYVAVKDAIVYDTGFIASGSADSHTYEPGGYTGLDPITSCLRTSEPLEFGRQYHWHVRYRDTGGDWSDWSNDDPYPHQDFYTAMPGDSDRDGDVDGDDYDHFATCYSGPAVPQSDPGCLNMDLDDDEDVDQSDFGIFQRCFSGQDHPADPACAD